MNPSGRYLLPLIPAMLIALFALAILGWSWRIVLLALFAVTYLVGVIALRDRLRNQRPWGALYLLPVVPAVLIALMGVASVDWASSANRSTATMPPADPLTWVIVAFALFVPTYALGVVVVRRRS